MTDRYKLFYERLVNMLTYTFIRGRKTILYIQALCYPLQIVNDENQQFFKDKLLESRMTSQVMWFEWYLNFKFEQYFEDISDRIVIKHFTDYGVPVYLEGEANLKPFVLYQESETTESPIPTEKAQPLYLKDEAFIKMGASFEVMVPSLTISQEEFKPMISYIIERYRIATKLYKITYE